jgi:hypothetical protein
MLAPTGPFSLMSLCHAKLKMIHFMTGVSIYELELFDRVAIWCRVYNDKWTPLTQFDGKSLLVWLLHYYCAVSPSQIGSSKTQLTKTWKWCQSFFLLQISFLQHANFHQLILAETRLYLFCNDLVMQIVHKSFSCSDQTSMILVHGSEYDDQFERA